MKEKTAAALQTLCRLTLDNIGFVIVWAISVSIILKLACV